MKKLLTLFLLLPLLSFGQSSWTNGSTTSSGEFDITWEYGGVTTEWERDIDRVVLGDTLIMKLKVNNLKGYPVDYLHVDVQHNKNAFSVVEVTYLTGGSPTNNTWTQTGYKFNPLSAYDTHDLYNQWFGTIGAGEGYQANSDWVVNHYQTQVVDTSNNEVDGYFLEIKYKVLNTDPTFDYTNSIMINMALAQSNNNSSNTQYSFNGTTYAYPYQGFTLEPDRNVYLSTGVTLKSTVTNLNPNEVKLYLYYKSDPSTYDLVPRKNSAFGYDPLVPDDNMLTYLSDEYDLAEGVEYAIIYHWNSQTDYEQMYDTYIVTISDVALLLKTFNESGLTHDTFNNNLPFAIQAMNADVNWDYKLDTADSYKLLAHIMGVEKMWEAAPYNYTNGNNWYYNSMGGYDVDGYNTMVISDYLVNNQKIVGGHLIPITIDFTATGNQQIEHIVAFRGDVNLSHSPTPSGGVTAKSTSYITKTAYDPFGGLYTPENVYGQFGTELKDGKVVATMRLPLEKDMSAFQVKLRFDDTILDFESVNINSGNTTTNFSNVKGNVLDLGGINLEKSKIENGVIEVIFTPKENITNTAGLITIFHTDAADMDARKLNLFL